jgi:hypothetical protein
MKLTTSQLSIDEGPGPKTTKPVDKTEETTAPDEEATKPDQAEEVITDVETTPTGTAYTAIFAKSRGTDKRNAGKG